MDAYFLKMSVGPVLAEALSVAVQTNPADPIDFLGHYLINASELQKKNAEWQQQVALESEAAAKRETSEPSPASAESSADS